MDQASDSPQSSSKNVRFITSCYLMVNIHAEYEKIFDV